MAVNSPTNTRILPTGQVSVSDIKLVDTTYSTNVNITTVEGKWMNGSGNPSRASSSAPGLCMPGQAQKPGGPSGAVWTYSPPSGFTNADAWKSTAMSEFRNAYTDRPGLTVAALATGETTSGGYYYGAMRCTGSTPNGNISPYSFWIVLASGTGSIREGSGNGWYVANVSSVQRDIKITSSTSSNSYWTVSVRDANNCGQNFEFTVANTKYP